MYNRDFGGIKSDGQLYNLEREYNRHNHQEDFQPQEPNHQPVEKNVAEKRQGLDFLRNLQIDDLVLMGIGLLLLLDSDQENDILLLLIVFLMLF